MNRPTGGLTVGVLDDPCRADRAVEELHAAGFSMTQVGMAVRPADEGERVRQLSGSLAEEKEEGKLDIAAGGIAGGLLGAAVTLLVPGVGPVLAGGLLAGVGIGAAVGTAAGGILGGLIGLGVPEDQARRFEQEVHRGRILVTVRAAGRETEARAILRRHGAIDVSEPEANPPTDLPIERLDELG